jgi:hypothetical protein
MSEIVEDAKGDKTCLHGNASLSECMTSIIDASGSGHGATLRYAGLKLLMA